MAGVRRTWDKDYYEQKARERAEKGEDYDKIETETVERKHVKEEFKPAEEGAAGPMGSSRAFVQPRQNKIDLDSKVGKVEVINPASAESAHGAGFWCEVCQILSKDSVSYLDHINGKRHQQALGFSMRTERANVDSVKKKLEELKNQKLNKKAAPVVTYTKEENFEMYESKLEQDRQEEEARKKRRKEEFQAYKEAKKQKMEEEHENDDEEEGDDMATMLGFKGFGSSKK